MRNNANSFFILATLVCMGCDGSTASLAQSLSPIQPVSEWRAVDPELFKVDPNNYPRFAVGRAIRPPRIVIPISMIEIKMDDVWEVVYKLGDFYLIFSKTYNDRQCFMLAEGKERASDIAHISPFSGKCSSRYLYCIYVDLDGNVTGGWQLIPNPDVVTSKSARSRNLKPNPGEINVWGAQPVFRKLTTN